MSLNKYEFFQEAVHNYEKYGDIRLPKGIAVWILYDKELAEKALQRNMNIRILSQNGVAQCVQDMSSGNWRENGETIVFDENGNLRNGQHRLTGVVESDSRIWILTVLDVPANQCDIYDIQMRRTMKQVAGKEASAAALTIAGRMCCGFRQSTAQGSVMEYYLAHKDDCEYIASISKKGARNCIGRKAGCQLAAYVHKLFGAKNNDLEDFFKALNTGLPVEGRESSSALVFRKQLEKIGTGGASKILETAKLCTKAIDDFANGKSRKQMYTPDETWEDRFHAAQNM